MTLVNPWFTPNIYSVCLLTKQNNNEWDSEKQNKNGHRHKPPSQWGMTKKAGLQNSSWKGMSEEAVMKACRMSGKNGQRCTVCPSCRRVGGPQGKLPSPWFIKIKTCCSSWELSWRTYQSILWVLEVLVLKRRRSRFRSGGRAKYVKTPSTLNRKSNSIYACPILCSFWSLLFVAISKIILGLKGYLLWSAVATFM